MKPGYFAKRPKHNYINWSSRHSANVFSLSFKEVKFLFLIVIAKCAILTPPAGEINKMLRQKKKLKICTKRDHFYVILMFAVTSYTVHSKKINLLYYTYYQTYHFTMFVMGNLYNHRYVSKVYLYSHDIYKGSMHNKRFLILHYG